MALRLFLFLIQLPLLLILHEHVADQQVSAFGAEVAVAAPTGFAAVDAMAVAAVAVVAVVCSGPVAACIVVMVFGSHATVVIARWRRQCRQWRRSWWRRRCSCRRRCGRNNCKAASAIARAAALATVKVKAAVQI